MSECIETDGGNPFVIQEQHVGYQPDDPRLNVNSIRERFKDFFDESDLRDTMDQWITIEGQHRTFAKRWTGCTIFPIKSSSKKTTIFNLVESQDHVSETSSKQFTVSDMNLSSNLN